MAAEVEEEFCRNGKKFPNYGKEKDISATTLVAPTYKYHHPNVLFDMRLKYQEPMSIATKTVMTPFRMTVMELYFCTVA